MRSYGTRAVLATAAVAGMLALSACGATGTTTPETSTPGAADAATTALTISVRASPEASKTTDYVLLCDGAVPQTGSTIPDPAAGCAAVVKVGAAGFEAPPKTQACTMQMGLPVTATVEGTLSGKPVFGNFSQTTGCLIDQWNALAPLFGPVSALK